MSRNTKEKKTWKKAYKSKRMKAAIMVFVLSFLCGMPTFASTLSKAKDTKNQAESNLNSQQQKISDIETQKNEIQTEMNALDAELSEVLVNIEILTNEITAKTAELEDVNNQLTVATQNAETEYAQMKLRIQFMYENGDNTLVQSLFESKDISDFINRVEYVNSMYEYDRNLLTQYQETQQEVANLKIQVEGEKQELEEIQTTYQEQEASLQTMVAQKQTEMSDFDTQLSNAKTLAAQYAATIEQQNTIIKEEQQKQAAAQAAALAAANNAKKTTASTSAGTSQTAGSTASAGTTGTSSGTTGTDTSSGSTASDTTASSGSNPSYSTGVSGSSVVSYAMQFVGNPYVSGGTSLTDGADCSGFIMSVYANFGVSLPHSSSAMAGCGQAVSYDNIQPGDIVCYTGHVAIYIGGGQIVNASSSAPYPVGGIKTNSATYRTITTIRRVL